MAEEDDGSDFEADLAAAKIKSRPRAPAARGRAGKASFSADFDEDADEDDTMDLSQDPSEGIAAIEHQLKVLKVRSTHAQTGRDTSIASPRPLSHVAFLVWICVFRSNRPRAAPSVARLSRRLSRSSSSTANRRSTWCRRRATRFEEWRNCSWTRRTPPTTRPSRSQKVETHTSRAGAIDPLRFALTLSVLCVRYELRLPAPWRCSSLPSMA